MIKTLIMFFFIIFFACSPEKKTVETAYTEPAKGRIPDNCIWDMDVNITSEGNLKAKFKGGYVERQSMSSSKYTISNIDSGLIIDFFENGKNTGNLKSEKGRINDLSEVFTAIENVVFNSNKGYVLYTDTLYWDRKRAVIFTESHVKMIKNERDTMYGKGFITDDKFVSYEVKKPRGRTIIEEQNKIE